MGEARRKNLFRFQEPGTNRHGVDAEVASETHQFDSIVTAPEDQKEAFQKLNLQLARVKSLGVVFLNSPGGPATVLLEDYIQKCLTRAELVVLSKLVEEKLGVPAKEYIQRTADELERCMDMEQMANKLIITPDGVFKDKS